MLTCLCDGFYGEVGIATVRVLEHAGYKVEFPPEQTCCGQPPFNAGDWSAARPIVMRCAGIFEGEVPVVTPSASCAAMVRHGYGMLMAKSPFRCFELCEFLTRVAGITAWPCRGLSRRKVAFHRSCHGRVLDLGTIQRDLVASIPGIDLVDLAEEEQCCGFGGAFSATHPTISSGIGMAKLENILATGATEIVGGDMGCLMHLDGLIRRNDLPLRVRHVAEILAEAIP